VGFADVYNIQDVMALAMMAATIGLVLGGVVGGPVGEWLLRRYKIVGPGARGVQTQRESVPEATVDARQPMDTFTFVGTLASVFVCLGVGEFLAAAFSDLPVNIPGFLWCLLTGIVIRNVG